MARIVTIIVASGSGRRMGGEIPKQFIELDGLPILMHTIRNYAAAIEALSESMGVSNRMVVVISGDCVELWKELCLEHNFEIAHDVVQGGATRFESVQCGLKHIKKEVNPSPCLVAVHDGVRPFVECRTVELAIKSAFAVGSGVAATEMVDSVRVIDGAGHSHPLERTRVRAVQTPQIFKYQVITHSYQQPYQSVFTDDASVCQSSGYPIRLVASGANNIKITTPKDLAVAQYILRNYNPVKK